MSPLAPKTYLMALTAQEIERRLLSIDNMLTKDVIRQSLTNPDAATVPSTKAVSDALDPITQTLTGLGNLASKDSISLDSNEASGTLPISKGGSGGSNLSEAQHNLGILSQTEIQQLINNSIPTIQQVWLDSVQVNGILPIAKGGTGSSSPAQALKNLGIHDSNGKVPVSQLPAVAITDTFPVSSEAAMLSLTAEKGDVAIRTDINKSFILMQEPASILANWKELLNDAEVKLTPGIRESLRRSYAEAGYNLVAGSFETGGTLVNANDVLLQDSTGKAYSGPAGAVAPGTDPTSGGFVDRSSELLLTALGQIDGASKIGSATYAEMRAYLGEAPTIYCLGAVSVFDGRYGYFDLDSSDTSSTDDGITVIVSAAGRRYKRRHSGPLSPRFAGVVGDGVVDDYAACAALINAFKKRGTAAPGGIDMGGDGIDWTGYKCRLSQTLDLTGLSNYSFTNPTFAAHSSFSGNALLRIDSDHTYLVSGITWINPQLDGAWLANYCVEACDFLKWTLIGGKFTHYKKKGFATGTVHDAPHEINIIGTFFFQREYNETYPPSITEGEAFFVDNYDNEFTNIVVGYQKQWAFTLNKGANRFVGGHIYTGWNSDPAIGGVRSLDNGDDFIGTYFDNTWVKMNARFSCNGCQFLVGTATGAVAAILDNDPYQVKMTDCRFKKLGANTQVISMPTVAAGRTSRPDIYDNEYENCSGITTRGPWFNALNTAVVTVPVPDNFLPLGNFSMPGRAASATGAVADRIHGAAYDATTNTMTINTYQIQAGGTLTPAALGGSMVMNMNV